MVSSLGTNYSLVGKKRSCWSKNCLRAMLGPTWGNLPTTFLWRLGGLHTDRPVLSTMKCMCLLFTNAVHTGHVALPAEDRASSTEVSNPLMSP